METATFNYDRDIQPLSYFAGRICHDLNNLITSSMGASSLLELKLSLNPTVNLSSEMERLNRSIENYQKFTQRLSQVFLDFQESMIPLDINLVVKSALQGIERPIELHLLPDPLKIKMDGSQLTHGIKELVLNAIEASDETSPIKIELTKSEKDGQPGISFSCQDHGKGILAENMPKLFTPFFSVGKRGNLVGLGLPQAGYILYQHGSTLSIHSAQGQGTRAEFFLKAE